MMTTTAATPWPARAAYLSAAIFAAASGGTNFIYGWQKGGDLAGSLVWASVSIGVSIVFVLSWPAFIRSVDARQWPRAAMVLIALLLTGTYSVSAALGSAAGGRTNAATTETATTDTRKKAQDAYDAAKAELDALAPAKPASELQALIETAKAELAKLAPGRSVAEVEAVLRAAHRDPQRYSCAFINGSLGMSCPKLDGELARARQRERQTAKIAGWTDAISQAEERRTEQRARLKADMERASGELAKIQPAKVANSDAVALAAYLTGLGFQTDAERLNKLLVLLAVLVIECGGGLSLAVGMSLSAVPSATMDAAVSAPGHPQTVPSATPDAPVSGQPHPPFGVAAWLKLQGGRAETSMRRLADTLGRSRSGVHEELRRLVASGLITAASGPRGTVLAMVGAANRSDVLTIRP